jgi:hypothetical protein
LTDNTTLPVARFLETMEIVFREGTHLAYSWGRVFSQPIDAAWVCRLDASPQDAEMLEAFVSRFGRMQDTIAGKLLPRWLLALAEVPGSQIEVLNRAERLGVLRDAQRWLEARNLRNRLVHEYARCAEDFARDLMLAKESTSLLIATYNQVGSFAADRMGLEKKSLPGRLELPASGESSKT